MRSQKLTEGFRNLVMDKMETESYAYIPPHVVYRTARSCTEIVSGTSFSSDQEGLKGKVCGLTREIVSLS